MPFSISITVILFAGGAIAALLFAIGPGDYPNLHTILDTGTAVLSGILALLLWDIGMRVRREVLARLAVCFAVVAVMDLLHALVAVEWSGYFAGIAEAATALRPASLAPTMNLLPIGVLFALRRDDDQPGFPATFAAALAVLGAILLAANQWIPQYTEPTLLGITRPSLIAAPPLWAIVIWNVWRHRATDRLIRPFLPTAIVMMLAMSVMAYSRAPADTVAIVFHIGRITAYIVLLVALMQIATRDMQERIRAEAALAEINQQLELLVEERTADLRAANRFLEAEIGSRRTAEQKLQAQLQRLNLLHRITQATGERQDLKSIFQVVVRSLEDELPVDFACLCLYDAIDHALTVDCVGAKSGALARDLAMPERAKIEIDENGLSQCVRGRLVYEPDLDKVNFPFPRRLASGGLRSFVAAPLQVEGRVFGVLIVANVAAKSFDSGECEFLNQLSLHVALAAHQSQIYTALQQAYDDLRQTQQAAMQQERLRALGQMASGVAHDINNALSPVTLYTDLLLETETDLDARARGFLETIQRAVQDVAHTVERLKEFYRQREPQLTLAPVQLNQLVEHVIEFTRARWTDMPLQRGIVVQMRTELDPDLPAIMGVDSEIREALINLVFNAVDAMPNGGAVALRTRVVKPPTATGSGSVQVEVADNGVGMDEDTRRRCLEPFFTTKGERGTGLGLAMVYGIVRRHGAEIDIESTPGKGTTIALTFPAVANAVAAPAHAEHVPKPAARLRLLIIDDDPMLLKSLCDALEAEGHVVTATRGGEEGIAAFRDTMKDAEKFAAVITDLGMPKIDGRKVASAIKEASQSTPVILLTGWGQRLLSGQEIPPHVDCVLSKPPKLRELREALVHLCRSPDS